MEQSGDHPTNLNALCDQLASDYAAYLHVDISKQTKQLDDVIEENLMHLEEVCTLLDQMRTQNSHLLNQVTPRLIQKLDPLERILERIDQIEHFVKIVGDTVRTHEKHLDQAEQVLSKKSSVQRLFNSFIGRSKVDSVTDMNTNMAVVANTYHAPEIRFDKYFDHKGKEEESTKTTATMIPSTSSQIR